MTKIKKTEPILFSSNHEEYTTTRKIGKCTYIISSYFAKSSQADIASILTRLIQSESGKMLTAK